MSSLGEEFPKQQARCRELLQQYKAIGQPGTFAHAMISELLTRADVAVMHGDVVAMLAIYKEMEECS